MPGRCNERAATRIYTEIEALYKDHIEALDRMGMNGLEAKTLELDAKTLDSTEVTPAKDSSSPFGEAASIETVDIKKIGKPYTPAEIDAEIKKVEGEGSPAGYIGTQIN